MTIPSFAKKKKKITRENTVHNCVTDHRNNRNFSETGELWLLPGEFLQKDSPVHISELKGWVKDFRGGVDLLLRKWSSCRWQLSANTDRQKQLCSWYTTETSLVFCATDLQTQEKWCDWSSMVSSCCFQIESFIINCVFEAMMHWDLRSHYLSATSVVNLNQNFDRKSFYFILNIWAICFIKYQTKLYKNRVVNHIWQVKTPRQKERFASLGRQSDSAFFYH